MNSGKYLYKSQNLINSAVPQTPMQVETQKESTFKKQNLLNNKRKLTFFDNDFVGIFKNFIFEINKKDEEKRLKRKKKLMNLNGLNSYIGSQSLNQLLGNIYADPKVTDSNVSLSKEHQSKKYNIFNIKHY